MKTLAAIPCHDEAQFIADIVADAKAHVDEVVVVDDGSTDNTAEVAESSGATVIRHEVNEGPGIAYKRCLEAARARDADILVTLDGDGQHDPREIPWLLEPLRAGEADLVIGSRFLEEYEIPRYRKFGIDVITWLHNLGSSVRVTDAQSCYRGYSRRALDSLSITEAGFGFSVELLVQARGNGLVIKEVPVSCIYHSASHSMNPVLHGVGVALMVLKHRLRSGWRQLRGRTLCEAGNHDSDSQR
jgi:glycosyltransferase involved in cell wall biosynthesis